MLHGQLCFNRLIGGSDTRNNGIQYTCMCCIIMYVVTLSFKYVEIMKKQNVIYLSGRIFGQA